MGEQAISARFRAGIFCMDRTTRGDQIAMKCRFLIMGRRSKDGSARWLAQAILPVADLDEAKIQAHHFPNTASWIEGAEGVRVLDKDGREIYSWWLAEKNEV